MSAVDTVADLSTEHIGWIIKVADKDPVIRSRRFELAGIRTWAYQGQTTVGLVDPTNAGGPWIGEERHYEPGTACELVGPAPKRRRRRTGVQ